MEERTSLATIFPFTSLALPPDLHYFPLRAVGSSANRQSISSSRQTHSGWLLGGNWQAGRSFIVATRTESTSSGWSPLSSLCHYKSTAIAAVPVKEIYSLDADTTASQVCFLQTHEKDATGHGLLITWTHLLTNETSLRSSSYACLWVFQICCTEKRSGKMWWVQTRRLQKEIPTVRSYQEQTRWTSLYELTSLV